MSHIPITPVTKSKKLPMIVDIALDDNGKQLYQIHESSKFVRKEMPKSTKFYQNQPTDLIDDSFQDKTPIRKILGTISPSTLNKKNSDDEDDQHFDNFHENELKDDFLNYQFDSNLPDQLSKSLPNSGPPSNINSLPGSVSEQSQMGPLTGSSGSSNQIPGQISGQLSSMPAPISNPLKEDTSKSHDIWSDDVEQAFEEVLSIIPKNGLNKIKISGRSCGRNELISDYILTKTGKFRTRKQVSSHIQVIKNLGQKYNIIQLINEGPAFNSEQEQLENMKKFEEIFSKINLDKSLGLNKKRQFDEFNQGSKKKKPSFSSSSSNPSNVNHTTGTSSTKANVASDINNSINLSIENFYMSVYDNLLTNPIILSLQNNQEIKSLKLKPNANISNRFPDLNEFKAFPIIHNLVKLNLPNLPMHYTLDNGLKTNFTIKSTENMDDSVSIFTIIYNYGKEVFKINEDAIPLNTNTNFLIKFWKYFLNNELISDGNNLNHLTIKQIIYENSHHDNLTNVKLPKLKIKTIFLWEFLKVDDLKHAITTTSKLSLPDEIVPQVINYPYDYGHGNHDASSSAHTTNQPAGSSASHSASHSSQPTMAANYGGPSSLHSSTSITTSLPQSLSSMPSSIQSNMLSSTSYAPDINDEYFDKDKLSKPQLAQKKFQALQHDYYSQPYYYQDPHTVGGPSAGGAIAGGPVAGGPVAGGPMVPPSQHLPYPPAQHPQLHPSSQHPPHHPSSQPIAQQQAAGQAAGQAMDYDYQFFYDANYLEY